ncbi:MAG TPA: hypothetical protein VEH57_08285 [Thermoplasmata archaeon]|nr:hypothetical protein [Thermoplasmata archaeon]
MHSYIDLYFSPEGVSPLDIAERIRSATGLPLIPGPHDLVFEWRTVEEFHDLLAKVHAALRGTGVVYRVETVSDEPAFIEPVPWPPPIHRGRPVHPGF